MNDTDTREAGFSHSAQKRQQPYFSRGALVAVIAVVAALVAILAILSAGSPAGKATIVAPQTCGGNIVSYINTNLVQPGTSATLVSVAENRGIYEVKILYESREMTIYATRDCTMLFTSSIDMNAPAAGGCGTGTTVTPAQSQEPVKTSRPAIDLFVMAFCPYGTQAEAAMKPVAALLGQRVDIRVRYITTISGKDVSSVRSLHGAPEALEDLHQICILQHSPEKFWDYLSRFNDQCYPQSQNPAVLDTCRENVTAAAGIDNQTISACSTGGEGLSLLREDEALSGKYGATASPTLIINGQEYLGSRTPEDYKLTICAHFDTPPEECSTTLLSRQGSTVSGGCG